MNIPTDKSTFLIQSSKNQSFGTGFVVKKDEHGSYLVTCTHVVEECQEKFLEVSSLKAELLSKGSSSDIDLAILYIKGLTNTKTLSLCSNSIDENVLFEINGFKPHKRESFKLEKLDGAIKKISEIHTNTKSITTYELSLEKEDNIEKGYSGSAVVLQGTDSVIAIATDRNQNGKDAYAIPIAYLKEIWDNLPNFVSCEDESSNLKLKNKEKKESFMEMKYLVPIIVAIITGLFLFGTEMMKSTSVPIPTKNINMQEVNISQSHFEINQ